jgi:hypothetical protein
VIPRRGLVPYLLLGTLTLGAGLGIGLGLWEGPVTYNANSVQWTCTSSRIQGEARVSCDSTKAKMSAWTSNLDTLPKGIAACLTTALQAVTPPKNNADYGTAFRAAQKKCGFPTASNGTFKHFFENPTTLPPKGYASCESNGHKARLVRLGSAAFKRAVTESGESCAWANGVSSSLTGPG